MGESTTPGARAVKAKASALRTALTAGAGVVQPRPRAGGGPDGGLAMIRVRTRQYSFQLVREAEPVYPTRAEVTTARDVARIAQHVIGAEISECVIVLFLNARHRVTGFAEVARGTLNSARFGPRDVLTPALHAGCAAVVVAHQHPSGDSHPSAADRLATAALRSACDLIGIPLLDHVIVSADGPYYSFCEAEAWE